MKVIAVDTSAIMAILLREPDAERYAAALVDADEVLISASTLLEATIVATRLAGSANAIEQMVSSQLVTVVPFDSQQLLEAQQGFLRFGKGRHPAGLNFGDCFSYALAKVRELPLLWKGDDFARTDMLSALDVPLHEQSKAGAKEGQ